MSVIPKIRFKGFNDAWEQRKLGDITSLITKGTTPKDKSGHGEVNFIKVENIDETSGEVIGLSKISLEEHQGYLKRSQLQEGDILFSIAGTLGRVISINSDILPANTNQALSIIRLKEGNLDYVKTCLKGNVVSDFIRRNPTIGAQPNLSLEQVSNLEIGMPSIVEQEKIGGYFKRLDNLITLHQRKCDETKELKKYMLQKMFPKKGEKVPEIRFKGFTDAWEQRKFSECYKMTSGYAFKMSDYCDTGVGLINGESIQHGIINDDNLNYLPESFIQQYSEFLLKESDIVVGLNRPITNGNLKIARIPSKYNNSLLYQRAGKIVYKIDCDKNFTYVLLSQEILKHTLVEAVGSDQPFISTSKLDNWKMMMPSDMEEQEKIGLYFTSLDHLITLHQRKCDSLKELKKYMLQNMFPKEG